MVVLAKVSGLVSMWFCRCVVVCWFVDSGCLRGLY